MSEHRQLVLVERRARRRRRTAVDRLAVAGCGQAMPGSRGAMETMPSASPAADLLKADRGECVDDARRAVAVEVDEAAMA